MSRVRRDANTLTAAGLAGPGVSEFRADCPCPKSGCERHGRCRECRDKHGRKGQLPRCER
jgi:hypothetical protein